jgi:hypothetical protein
MKTPLSHQEISSAYSDHIQSLLTANAELTPFFVTTKLKYIQLDDVLSRKLKYPLLSNEVWKCYTRFYRHLVSQLTNNWQKKRHLLPLTFDCLDIDRTRETKAVRFTWSTKPHIHSIYLVHRDVLPAFQSLASESCYSLLEHPSIRPTIESVHIEPASKLERLVSYSMKFAETYQLQRDADDVELIYQQPIALSETTREQNKRLLQKHPEQREAMKTRFPEQRIKRMLRQSRQEMLQRFSAKRINREPPQFRERSKMKRHVYTRSISFRCSPRLLSAVETFAEKHQCHSSNVIREAIVRYLNADRSSDATQL